MKLKVASLRRLGVCCLAWTSVCGAVFATEFPTVKVKWFETAITPEIGTLIAGYEEHDVSTSNPRFHCSAALRHKPSSCSFPPQQKRS